MKRLIVLATIVLTGLAASATAPANSCAAGNTPTCGGGGWSCIYVGYTGPNGEPWYCYEYSSGTWTWRW